MEERLRFHDLLRRSSMSWVVGRSVSPHREEDAGELSRQGHDGDGAPPFLRDLLRPEDVAVLWSCSQSFFARGPLFHL